MLLSAGFTTSAARSQLVVDGRSSGPRAGGAAGVAAGADVGVVAAPVGRAGGASARPTVLSASIRPGYTVRPSPSMIQASAGAVTLAPTASMRPLRTTTVACSSAGP